MSTAHAPARGAHPKTRTMLGSYGVTSSAIIAENKRAGSTNWKLSATPAGGSIAGFADTTYASIGQTVTLYVTTTAPRFHIVAYRMGYYQGKGARQIWQSAEVPGVVQPPCPVTPQINMVSCGNWSPSLSVKVTSAFVQGDYLLKLVGTGNQQSYVLLTIWDPRNTAAYLLMARSMTEEGWNTYGGYSYYQGEGPCTLGQAGTYPPCNRARVVSFDRPMLTGQGASDFLGSEYPLVRFMEQHGLDAAYCSDVTVDAHPTVLLHHRALLSLDHDETWTYAQRAAAQRALDRGVNLVFFGAAALVRHARLQPSPLGPDRELVDYRDSSEDPLDTSGGANTVTGNTFATPPTSDPVTSLVGSEYSGYVLPAVASLPFVVYAVTSWIFKGTGLKAGASVPGVIRSDINHVNPTAAPSDLEVLGHSPIPLADAYSNQGQWNGDTYSDMTYYTRPTGGGGVFDSGTVNWLYALNPCASTGGSCTGLAVGLITANLLRAVGGGPAGKSHPSVPNAKTVVPPGS
ncbi:MAG: N,N-dimethylformamidase beta subunit family domain-containing protein [Acidimicrobiales bacterium]